MFFYKVKKQYHVNQAKDKNSFSFIFSTIALKNKYSNLINNNSTIANRGSFLESGSSLSPFPSASVSGSGLYRRDKSSSLSIGFARNRKNVRN